MIVFSFFVPDETQDAAHQDEQTSRVRDWINSRHITTIDLADILANFPDISLVKIDILLLNFDSALYYALPMDYVTISKLQSKLAGVANHSTVRKLIDKMEQDGYIKNTGNRRLGKRVIHSESSNRKLLEVKQFLEQKTMEIDTNCQTFEFNNLEFPPGVQIWHDNILNINCFLSLSIDKIMNNGSTFGGLHSIGSDLTRTQARSKPHQSGQLLNDQAAHTSDQERGNTPTSNPASYNLQPIASLESGVVGERPNAMTLCAGDVSNSTEDKRLRKASTVEEPILQYVKRQKSQA
ncbi:hypothetical protein GW17_00001069 [Ensete ventricosum]|nr:hypothetical protein GW17_00001069 [Ensete ventricosum]